MLIVCTLDLLTLNGSKIYGPKGVGCYLKTRPKDSAVDFRRRTRIALRPGTENTAGIIGLVTALELAQKIKTKKTKD